MKVLFLIPAPANISPGQRFRFEHYLALNTANEYEFVTKPFFSEYTWSIIHLPKYYIQKSFGILSGFIKRFLVLFTLYKYNYVYIYREASVIGPPVFEWLIAKVFNKKIIYDFDDAIWVSVASESNPGAAIIKCTWKVANICRMSHIVTVGNQFLHDYASQFCNDVRIIPTVVDTNNRHNRTKNQEDIPIYIGWTGTYTNFYNLQKITGIITELKRKYNFTFLIIADKDPKFAGTDYVYQKWNVNTEIDDLLKIHIGIMPLEHTEIELGKCGFKAIQYMSLGIPAVVSPVGANKNVVTNEENGFWVEKDADWYEKLELLLKNSELRTIIGKKAKAHIVANFSVDSSKKIFFDLFSSSEPS